MRGFPGEGAGRKVEKKMIQLCFILKNQSPQFLKTEILITKSR